MLLDSPSMSDRQRSWKKCGWFNIVDLTEYHSLCQVWKIVNWGTPQHMKDKIHRTEDNKLETEVPRLKLTAATFRCRSILKWNKLPDALRDEKQLKRFKVMLKRWMRERPTEDTVEDQDEVDVDPGDLQD